MVTDLTNSAYYIPYFTTNNSVEGEIIEGSSGTFLEEFQKQGSIDSASGEYLDRLGALFGLKRTESEDETYFRTRILQCLKIPQENIPIEKPMTRYDILKACND